MMGDNNIISSPSILEVLDDLWLVENQIVNPNSEQVISALSIDDGYRHHRNHEGLTENGNVFSLAEEGGIFPNVGSDYMFVDQENSIVIADSLSSGKDLSSWKKVKGRKPSKCKKSKSVEEKRQTGIQSEVEEEESVIKKQEHNAKERIRRMKISETYMDLGSLLPTSRPSNLKKRWTAPRIIDKVLEYIPELENEIEELTIKKKNTQSAVENMPSSVVLLKKKISSSSSSAMASEVNKSFTVSVNEVKKGQLIFQICSQRNQQKDFSSLLESIEEDVGICLVSASTLHVCDQRDCYHIHIQIINESSSTSNGNDSSTVVREKVISWLS